MENLDYEMLVKRILREKNISGVYISNKLGISQAYFSEIIRGRRKALKIREKINKLLEINYKGEQK